MSTLNEQPDTALVTPPSPTSLWQRRFFIVLTILGWLILAAVIIWGIGLIITPLVLIGFSALLVGTALFGLLGAFFACPAAGIIQNFVRASWDTWHERHPDQFPVAEQEHNPVELADHDRHDQPAVST